MSNNQEAVVIDGRYVSLTVHYNTGDYSDSNCFSELIGGRSELTESEAVDAVIAQAKGWAANMRAEGHDLGVWDDAGNHY